MFAWTVEWHHTPLNICFSAVHAWHNWQPKIYGTIQMRWLIFLSSTTTNEGEELWATTKTSTNVESWHQIDEISGLLPCNDFAMFQHVRNYSQCSCYLLLFWHNAALGGSGGSNTIESTEHATMAPDSSSATSSCNSSTPSSPAVYHITSPSGYPPTRSADYTAHSQTFQFPGTRSFFVLLPYHLSCGLSYCLITQAQIPLRQLCGKNHELCHLHKSWKSASNLVANFHDLCHGLSWFVFAGFVTDFPRAL